MSPPQDQLHGDAPLLRLAGIGAAISERLGRAWAWLLRRPGWLQVALVWAVGRGYAAFLVVTTAAHQGPNPWSLAAPDYLAYIDGWDAGWFERIATGGYPTELPRDSSGALVNNPWAFLPLYPALVRVVMDATGAAWPVSASVVSLLASLVFFQLAHRLFLLRASPGTALAALTLLSVTPAVAVLQFPYSESLGLALLAGWLLLMERGRYAWAALLVPVIVLTRPLAAPLACACLILTGVLILTRRRAGAPLRGRALASLLVLDAVAVAAVGLWPAIAAWRTGIPNAYFLTEATWHGGRSLAPLTLFVRSFHTYAGLPGVALAGVALLLVAWAMFSRPTLQLGLVQWAWLGSVLGYQVLIAPFAPSLLRYLLAAFPLALAAVAVSTDRAYRTLLIAAAAASQIAWFALVWAWNGSPVPAP